MQESLIQMYKFIIIGQIEITGVCAKSDHMEMQPRA